MIARRILLSLLVLAAASTIPSVRAQIHYAWEAFPRYLALPPVWKNASTQEVIEHCGMHKIGCVERRWRDGLCYIWSGRKETDDPEHAEHEKHHCKGYEHRVTDLTQIFWRIR